MSKFERVVLAPDRGKRVAELADDNHRHRRWLGGAKRGSQLIRWWPVCHYRYRD